MDAFGLVAESSRALRDKWQMTLLPGSFSSTLNWPIVSGRLDSAPAYCLYLSLYIWLRLSSLICDSFIATLQSLLSWQLKHLQSFIWAALALLILITAQCIIAHSLGDNLRCTFTRSCLCWLINYTIKFIALERLGKAFGKRHSRYILWYI